MTQLAKHEAQEIQSAPIHVGAMIQAVVERGVTTENVAALEQLIKLHERIEAREAEKEFNRAFAALQAELPVIQKRRPVESKGQLLYRFAAFEDIMAQVAPCLKKHGFAVSFSMDAGDGRINMNCSLLHSGGHSRTNSFSVRAGKGPPNSSEAQGDGSNSTYAKRFALCNALNIVIEGMDDDARNLGETITAEQAFDIGRRVSALRIDAPAFLKWAQSESFAAIMSAKLPEIEQYLSAKEKEWKHVHHNEPPVNVQKQASEKPAGYTVVSVTLKGKTKAGDDCWMVCLEDENEKRTESLTDDEGIMRYAMERCGLPVMVTLGKRNGATVIEGIK